MSLILTNGLVYCLFVAETKLNDSHLPAKFTVNNFNTFRRDNKLDGGGGLICFLRSDIPAFKLEPDCGQMEGLQINCILDCKSWSFLCLYKKPEQMDALFDHSLNTCDNYVILVDLNCDIRKPNNVLTQVCNDFNLTNVIHEPTCYKGETPSLIDVILVSDRACRMNGEWG